MPVEQTYTIVLTGALGLVGCGITAYALPRGHRIVALDIRPSDADDQLLNGYGETTEADVALRRKALDAAAPGQYVYKQCDLTDFRKTKEVIKAAGCDAVIHLAAVYAKKDENGEYISGPSQDVIHNLNTAMSYNMMLIAAELDIRRLVVASSVNSIGMVFSKIPRFDYLPVDEQHPFYPEDAYSLSKYFVELQADSICRRYPALRIASMRFHWVVPTPINSREYLHKRGGNPKDLWSFVSLEKTAEACLLGLTAGSAPARTDGSAAVETQRQGVQHSQSTGAEWEGHETFFIAARTTCRQSPTADLVRERYPHITDLRFKDEHGSDRGIRANEALIDTSKAERLLGWKDEGFPWDA